MPEIYDMTKNELLNYAESNGIGGVDSTMKKADILKQIESSI